MERQAGAAAEIRQAIEGLLETFLGEEARHLRIPEPSRCEADASGCNWSLDYRSSCGEHEEAVRRAVEQAQREWSLRP